MQKGITEDLIVLYFLFSDMFIDSCTLIILFYVLNDFFSMQVTVSKDDTVILDGAGDKKSIEERADQVHAILLLLCAYLNCF